MGIPKRVLVYIIVLFVMAIVINHAAAQQSHSWSEINLPVGMWTGLDAEFLDSKTSNDIFANDFWEMDLDGNIHYNDGRVGVGTGAGAPNSTLHVKADGDWRGIWLTNSSGNHVLLLHDGGFLSRVVIFDDDLAVGRGAYPPSERLDVDGIINVTGICIGSDCRDEWAWERTWHQGIWNINYSIGYVGIGTSNPQGILDISSTDYGIILPRMDTTQRDVLPKYFFTVIYNTDTNRINFVPSTAGWKEL